MEVSVIIPTFGRPDKVAACVRLLAEQQMESAAFEVLVGIDGGEDDSESARRTEEAIRGVWPDSRASRLRVVPCRKSGQAAVRNVLTELAQGITLVFLNDDMRPSPTLLTKHVESQQAAVASGAPALVIGASPWVKPETDSLFARLIRETSMVFFYDRMDEAIRAGEVGADHDWGFRHAWLLNLSVPAALVREAGGFSVFPSTYGYEDDEFAFRCAKHFGTRVLYRPEAVAHHDHHLTPESYLVRERKLGFAAWGFAGTTPECALAMFGRDVRSEAELAYSREFVERERHNAERLRATFAELAGMPTDAVPEGEGSAVHPVIPALAQQHLLLKRWEWRRGLLDAAGDGASVREPEQAEADV